MMFVPGGLPWDLTPPNLPPLGGLLTMLEGKDGVRPPFALTQPVPRTAACVVLPQPTSSPVLALSPRNTPTSTHNTPYNKGSPPLTASPLKFGVDRLLAAEPPRKEYSQGVPVSTLLSQSHITSTSSPSLTSLAPSTPYTCPSVTPGVCACGCGAGRGRGECMGYYYTHPLYAHRHPHLVTYSQLYGSSVGSGGRHEVLGAAQGSHGRRKRTWTRAVFSNLQRKGLEKRFQLQKYITKPDRRQLAATLGLTDAQVKVWFQNRRMKWRHSEVKKREQHQQLQQQNEQHTESGTAKDSHSTEEESCDPCLIDQDPDDDEDEEIDLGSEVESENNTSVI